MRRERANLGMMLPRSSTARAATGAARTSGVRPAAPIGPCRPEGAGPTPRRRAPFLFRRQSRRQDGSRRRPLRSTRRCRQSASRRRRRPALGTRCTSGTRMAWTPFAPTEDPTRLAPRAHRRAQAPRAHRHRQAPRAHRHRCDATWGLGRPRRWLRVPGRGLTVPGMAVPWHSTPCCSPVAEYQCFPIGARATHRVRL